MWRHGDGVMSGGPAWTLEEDAAVRCLRRGGMAWRDIARHVTSRTAASCRKRLLRTLQEPDSRKVKWPADSLHRNREALRPGHPVLWQAITTGSPIAGSAYR